MKHRILLLFRTTVLTLPLLLISLNEAQAAQKSVWHGMSRTPSPSLFFEREHAAAIESAARHLPPSSAQASSRLTLESLVYWGPGDWTVWIHGKKWTAQNASDRTAQTNDHLPENTDIQGTGDRNNKDQVHPRETYTDLALPPDMTVIPATRHAEAAQQRRGKAGIGIQGAGDKTLNVETLSNKPSAPFRILSVGADYVVLTAKLKDGRWTAPTRLAPTQSLNLLTGEVTGE